MSAEPAPVESVQAVVPVPPTLAQQLSAAASGLADRDLLSLISQAQRYSSGAARRALGEKEREIRHAKALADRQAKQPANAPVKKARV